ncbi:MAG: hypothetical protein IT270_20030 [Saprospiraceae bacterium]|nr:hypothetical protein [Saprospiraceae bacterium]
MMNYYNISTKEALEAGKMNLKYIPMGLIYLGSMSVLVFMFKGFFLNEPNWEPFAIFSNPFLIFLFPLAGLVLSFAWRSFHSAAWKIWVLENVQDVHRVFQLAVSEGMIFERSSWMNKLEYRTYDQKIRLEELEQRLDKPRQMEVAGSMGLAGEQAIPYSINSILVQAIVVVGMFAGFYAFTSGKTAFPIQIFIIPVVFIGFHLVRWIPRFNSPAPLRFNNKELTVTNHPPVAWTNISDIRMESRKQGKSSTMYLVVETTGSGTLELNIGELKGSSAEIEDTLYQYWALAKKHATNA